MFIMALEKGYALIEQSEDGDYMIEDVENVDAPKVLMNLYEGTSREIHLLPIGQIVIDRFNKSWDDYKKKNGIRKEAIKKPTAHPLDGCPHWIFPKEKPVNYTLKDLISENRYIQAMYTQFMGNYVPIFNVADISELYFYDLHRLKEANIQIRQCCECGHAFIAKTQGKRCKNCRETGVGDKQKWNNLKSDPIRSKRKRILDRNRCKNDSTYFAKLNQIIDKHKDNDTETAFDEFLTILDKADKIYWKLKKYYDGYDEWENNKYSFLEAQDLIQWLIPWCDKAGIARP